MARFRIIFLIIVTSFTIFSTANEAVQNQGEPNVAPTSGPSNRKLGKNHHKLVNFSGDAPHLSPSESDPSQTKDDHSGSSKEVSSSGYQDHESAFMKEIWVKNLHHHASVKKSVVGGGVIIGGLATIFCVAIFCYIRATRRNSYKPQPSSP